ncbi:MAG: amidohydrolase family protein [Pseudobdellovibrionaceae bacterium]
MKITRIAVFIIITLVSIVAIWKFVTPSRVVAAPPSDFLPVIDVHTHTDFSNKKEPLSQIMESEEQYFKEMKEAGVVGTVAHMSRGQINYNSKLAESHVVHCFGIGDKIKLAALKKLLESKQVGCIKIYLGYVYRYAYDKAYHPVYKLAEQFGVPVVFHTGDTYSVDGKLKYSDPLTIDEVAVDFRKVNFVIAHLGNPWIQSAAEVAYKNPNVYVEASALLVGNLNEVPEKDKEEYLIKPIRWAFGYIEDPSKFMYGTDWPLVGMKEYLEAYKKAIPKEHWCAVFFENAVRVFRMDALKNKYKCQVSLNKK